MNLITRILVWLLICLIIMLIWNYVLIDVCNCVRKITYLEAIALKYLFTIISTNLSLLEKIVTSDKI